MRRYKCPICGRYWEDANPPLPPDSPPEEKAIKPCKDCAIAIKDGKRKIVKEPMGMTPSISIKEKSEKIETLVEESPESYIAKAVERCDNILANIRDEALRQRVHGLSRRLMIAYSFLVAHRVELYEKIADIISGIEAIKDLMGVEEANNLYEKYRLLLRLVEGPIKLKENDLDFENDNLDLLIKLLRDDVAELYLVPKGWIIDKPLWFRDYHHTEKEDLTKLKYDLHEVSKYIENIPGALKKSLNEIINELRGKITS